MRLKNRRYAGGGAFSVPLGTPGPKLAPVVSNYRFSQPFIPTGPKADRSKYKFDMSALSKVKGHTNAVNWFTNKVTALQNEMAGLSDVELLTNSPRAAELIQEYNQLVNQGTINAIQNDYDRTQEGKALIKERKAGNAFATTANGGVFVIDRESGNGSPAVVTLSEMANNPGRYAPMTVEKLLTYKDENPDMVLRDEPHFALESTFGMEYITEYIAGRLKSLGHRSGKGTREGIARLNNHLEGTSIPAMATVSSGWKDNRQNLKALEDTWLMLEAPMQAQLKANVARQFPPPDGKQWTGREIADMAKLLMVRAIFDPAVIVESESSTTWGSVPSSGSGSGGSGAVEDLDGLSAGFGMFTRGTFTEYTDPSRGNNLNMQVSVIEYDIPDYVENGEILNDAVVDGRIGGSDVYAADGTLIDPRRAKINGKPVAVHIPMKKDGSMATKEVIERSQELANEYINAKVPKGARLSPEQYREVQQGAYRYAREKLGNQYEFEPMMKTRVRYVARDGEDSAGALLDNGYAVEVPDSAFEGDKDFFDKVTAEADVDHGILFDDYQVMDMYVFTKPPTVVQGKIASGYKVRTPREAAMVGTASRATITEKGNNTDFNITPREGYGK